MKIRIIILYFFVILSGVLSGQGDSTRNLKGSWLGTVATNDWSPRVPFRFGPKGDHLRGYLDSPDQDIKDIPLDRFWRSGDSVFVAATKSKEKKYT